MLAKSDKQSSSFRSGGRALPMQTFFGERFDFSTEVEIEELVSLLEMSSGGTLVICVCNPPAFRRKILGYLGKRLSVFDVGIFDVDLGEEDEHIVKLLRRIEADSRFRRFEKRFRNVVISVMGVEKILHADRLRVSRFYQNLNLYRDFFIRTRYPVLFWVNDAVASELGVRAPDFWRARTKVVDFISREERMVQSMEQLAGMPVLYKDLADIKRRERIHERLLKSLDPTSTKDKRSYATIALSLGWLKYLQGNYGEARKLYKESFKIKRELGDKAGIGKSLHNLAMIEQLRGNYDKASELYQQSLKIKRELGDKAGIGKSLHNLAMTEQDRGNYDKASELYQQSLKIKRELEDKAGIAMSMGALGNLFEKRGQFEDALKHFLEAACLFHQLGSPYEKQALRGTARTAQKLSEEKFNKTMKETPEEIKAYLKQISQLQKLKYH